MTAVAAPPATCSSVAERLGEPTAGSASVIDSWILLEHPGPWRSDSRDEVSVEPLSHPPHTTPSNRAA